MAPATDGKPLGHRRALTPERGHVNRHTIDEPIGAWGRDMHDGHAFLLPVRVCVRDDIALTVRRRRCYRYRC